MYIKFTDSKNLLPCEIIPQNNIVTLKFQDNIVVDTSGFQVFLDINGEYDIGGSSYLNFTTIYRNDEITAKYNGYQLSSDKSIYIEEIFPEPEPSEPYEPTLEESKELKVASLNSTQQQIIKNGVDVKLSNDIIEHFTLTEHDQTSLMGLQAQVAMGENNIPWHTSNEQEHCKFYLNSDMQLIITAAMSYVTWHVTYFRDLRIYVRSLNTKEELNLVEYGIAIPEEFQSEPLKQMIAAQI